MPHGQAVPFYEFAEGCRASTVRAKHVKGFRQNRGRTHQRGGGGLQHADTSRVVRILFVEQGDERSGVDECHRDNFLRIALTTPSRTFAEEVMALPPGPISID